MYVYIRFFIVKVLLTPSRRGTRHARPWPRGLFRSRSPAFARDARIQHSGQRPFALNRSCPRWSSHSALLPSSSDVQSSFQSMSSSVGANGTCQSRGFNFFHSMYRLYFSRRPKLPRQFRYSIAADSSSAAYLKRWQLAAKILAYS